jgi:hypothetical protein
LSVPSTFRVANGGEDADGGVGGVAGGGVGGDVCAAAIPVNANSASAVTLTTLYSIRLSLKASGRGSRALPFDRTLCDAARPFKSIILVGQWNREFYARYMSRLWDYLDLTGLADVAVIEGKADIPFRSAKVRF